jgi:hypothetical protein
MTLEELAQSKREYFVPREIAPILGCAPIYITLRVKEDKELGINSFPFPTMRIGRVTKIPKRPFLKAMGYEEPEGE